MHEFGYYGAGWNWPMLVGSVVLWALLAVAVVAVIRYLARRDRPWAGAVTAHPAAPGTHLPPAPRTPAGILAERFARGEIDEQEFRHRVATLRGEAPGQDAPPPAP